MVEEKALTDPEGNCKITFYCNFSSIYLDFLSNIAYDKLVIKVFLRSIF